MLSKAIGATFGLGVGSGRGADTMVGENRLSSVAFAHDTRSPLAQHLSNDFTYVIAHLSIRTYLNNVLSLAQLGGMDRAHR